MSFILYFYSQSIQHRVKGPANMISHFLISSLMVLLLRCVFILLFGSWLYNNVVRRRKNHKNDDGTFFCRIVAMLLSNYDLEVCYYTQRTKSE